MVKNLSHIFITSTVLTLIAASVFVPAVYAASSTAGTTVNVNIGSAISISTSGTVNLSITPAGGGSASSASDSVAVSTNNATGYKLLLADSDSNNTLAKGSDTIVATSGTFAAPAALANNSWGYRIDGSGSFGAGTTTAQSNVASLSGTWAKVPLSGSPDTLKTTATTATNDTTTVWYGAKVDTTLPNGTYQGTVTYTATTN